jgi:hypothetical protein
VWYPISPACDGCEIKCNIQSSSRAKYMPEGTLKPTINRCPYGLHDKIVEWRQ